MEEHHQTAELLKWISKITHSEYIIEQERITSVLKLSNDFSFNYNKLEKQQPYHINVIDELHANENAHSRILRGLLRQKSNDQYEILQSLIEECLPDSWQIKIEKPIVTAEQHRIDLLIQEQGKYAIIFENKINYADFQANQFARYIEKMLDLGYKEDQVFVVYIPPFLYRDIPDECWAGKRKHYKSDFDERFTILTFKDNILPWLENNVLPNIRAKDIFLQSAVAQYIDHLQGKFGLRTINNKMNMELQEFLKQELEFGNNPVENIKKVEAKRKEIAKVLDQVSKLEHNTKKEIFEQWELEIEKEFPQFNVCHSYSGNIFVGVKVEFGDHKFQMYVECNQNGDMYYGASMCPHEQKVENINQILKPIFEKIGGFDYPKGWWYAWKKTSFENGYIRLKTLIEEVAKVLQEAKV